MYKLLYVDLLLLQNFMIYQTFGIKKLVLQWVEVSVPILVSKMFLHQAQINISLRVPLRSKKIKEFQ
jgi:hypothetical protein